MKRLPQGAYLVKQKNMGGTISAYGVYDANKTLITLGGPTQKDARQKAREVLETRTKTGS